MTRAPDPTAEQCEALNAEFYAAKPWIYFQQRLAHLMFVASDRDRYRAMLKGGFTAGTVNFKVELDDEDSTVPTPEQSFIAIETEILLHHSAETLLRFVHAHSDITPCPWVRMAGLTTFTTFKDWVRADVLDASQNDLAELCRRIFAVDPNSAANLDAYTRYLRLYARHFLAADSYNAAKHGMGLHGGNRRMHIEIDDRRLFERDGTSLSWLATWPRSDARQPPRWTRVSSLFDVDAAITLIATATDLMRSIWLRGRQRHLDAAWNEVYRPRSPQELFNDLGIRHHVLAQTYRPYPAAGEEGTMTVETAHLEIPEDETADRPSG